MLIPEDDNNDAKMNIVMMSMVMLMQIEDNNDNDDINQHVNNALCLTAPDPQAAVNDYNATQQQIDFPEFDEPKNFYCAKGHLTPNSDFGDEEEREETFILTNAAPQWQRFNEGNWLAIEAAIRNYVDDNSSEVYVFTGTGKCLFIWVSYLLFVCKLTYVI